MERISLQILEIKGLAQVVGLCACIVTWFARALNSP